MSDQLWTVTFGGDHVLRHGKVQVADPVLGGLPLAGFAFTVWAGTREEARAKVTEVFGAGWCDIYPATQRVMAKNHLWPLFGNHTTFKISALRLCTCGVPLFPHCHGWHTEEATDAIITYVDHAPGCPYQNSGDPSDCSCGRSAEEAQP